MQIGREPTTLSLIYNQIELTNMVLRSDTLPLTTLRVRCPQMRHLNLGRDSKCTGRIWRGIWLRVFSAPKQSPRQRKSTQTVGRFLISRMEHQ